ncbi:MAG: peptide chain release factor N(5)-glutamine methyltransferase [Demequina sp.]|nr:peptide chain release factor N(5)-glutamine methyltransferase [Demequina sp.]
MPTIGARVRATAQRLADAGVASPEVDTIELIAHTLGWESSEVRLAAARDDDWPDGADLDLLEARVTRRVDREPLQHITGKAHFRGLTLEVGPGVFVPRPESETVAQAAIDAAMTFLAAEDAASGKPVRVTDLCAGSGAIGLAIANEVPNALVTLVEASEDAWVYLRRNVRAQPPEVQERVRTVLADARNCLRHMDACADVVVANPPYIPSDMVPVDPEVEHYDPPQALYGLGPDGLQVPKDITDEAVRLLRIGGVLIVEHGDRQGLAMREFASSSVYWEGVSTLKDLTGRDRMLVARRIGA